MSYANGTTHYNLPQTVGTDKRDWFDTNEAFRNLDAAVYSAGQTAETAAQDLDGVKSDVQGLKDADIAMTGRVDGIEGRVGASEQAITRLQQDVADVDTDLKDSICAINEASATAAYAHASGEFFWYNDTLYKATTEIAVGQQIVPDTNCKTTNITTELVGGGGSGVEIDDTSVSATKVWSSYKTNTEITSASATKTGDTRFYSGKLQYWTGSAWVDVQIGGAMQCKMFGTGTVTGAGLSVDISSLGLSSEEDYFVIVNNEVRAASSGLTGVYISAKTATSFTLMASGSTEHASYQVIVVA